MKLNYNGEDLSPFLKIVKVNRGILPERENLRYEIPKLSGSHYSHYRYKEKIIPVEIIIISNDINLVRRALASFLDVKQPEKLIFDDEPDYYWMAVPDGAIDLEEILTLGRGTINFLCPKPWAYKTGESEFLLTPGQNEMTLYNYGTAPTSPKFEIDFTSDCGFVGIVSPKGIIQIGNKISPDTIAVPASEKLILTNFTGTGNTAWNKNLIQPIHINSQASGSVSEDGNGVRARDFGTYLSNKQWHGPVMSKGLATDTLGLNTADNWEIYSEFHFRTLDNNAIRAMAMMEFGVLDENNEYLAGVRFVDVMDIDSLVGILVYVGRNADQSGIERAQVWDESGYDYFNGSIYISKMGNNFNFVIHNWTTGKVFNRTIYNEVLGAKKAKTATIFMGQFKDAAAYNDMSVTHFKFIKHHTEKMQDVPNIFGVGDKLVISNETGKVTLNETPYLDTLDIGSKFFQIEPGSTEIGVIFSSWMSSNPTVKARFRERYY